MDVLSSPRSLLLVQNPKKALEVSCADTLGELDWISVTGTLYWNIPTGGQSEHGGKWRVLSTFKPMAGHAEQCVFDLWTI